ncbi:MAG: hypothetical protein ABIO70_02450 [Pseudomonadota bacterium]
MRFLALPLLLASACAVPVVDLPFDGDRDGLLDDEEQELGTDPLLPDSDADRWLDGEEFNSFTDPLDPDDHPYTGGWPIGECRHSLQGTGWTQGAVVQNTNNPDQFGDNVKLHDFCEVPYIFTYYAFS